MVGVLGAGVMGTGITQALLEKHIPVLLLDQNKKLLKHVPNNIKRQIMFHQMSTGKKDGTVDVERLLHCTMIMDDFNKVDFVIEAVTESIEIKREVYQALHRSCNKDCIIMSNTSCISITQLGSMTDRADKVIGTHFMNPVPYIDTVEVIKGMLTSDDTVNRVTELIGRMGKEVIVIEDMPGFVSNRISHLMMNEAAFIVQDKVATPKQVDDIFKKCYGHKMGPLETADLIGLDTVVDSLDVLYRSYQDSKFRCCPLLKKMVEAGLYGVKSGKGFYEY